ncbi:unnamed protein product [Durusdinium trenchii]|uniref:Uncharacterized protein n=2 Tax=Durusdinium trenchii TaxID=1381693 RepID=A0ABP0PMF0_9DINO
MQKACAVPHIGAMQLGMVWLGLIPMALVLSGCDTSRASYCTPEDIEVCRGERVAQMRRVCGPAAYSNVIIGNATVTECCQAMKAVQDCYTICSCKRMCNPPDQEFCPITGTYTDIINAYAFMVDNLVRNGESCNSVGVTRTKC